MGGSIFGSSSDTKSKAVDKSIQAADQAIVYAPERSGNLRNVGNVTNKLSNGATQIINNGIDADAFNDGLERLSEEFLVNANTNPVTQSADSGFNEAVLDALKNRTEASNERAIDEVKAGSPSTVKNYFLWGIGAVAVIGLLFAILKKRR